MFYSAYAGNVQQQKRSMENPHIWHIVSFKQLLELIFNVLYMDRWVNIQPLNTHVQTLPTQLPVAEDPCFGKSVPPLKQSSQL